MTLVEGGSLSLATGESRWISHQVGPLPAAALIRGRALRATTPLGIASTSEQTITLVPDAWEGTLFVIPHYRGRQFYSLLSPHGDTVADIALAGQHYTVRLPQGVAVDFEAGFEQGSAAVLRAGQPIRVAHWAIAEGLRSEPYPVPPASTERWGLLDSTALIAAAEDGTSLRLYTSEGAREERRLNAGEQVEWASEVVDAAAPPTVVGVVADKPIGALRASTTPAHSLSAWLGPSQLATHYGLPTGGVKVTVLCPLTTAVTLAISEKPPVSQVCFSAESHPGVIEFGPVAGEPAIVPGSYLESTRPVLAMAQPDRDQGSRALIGGRGEPVPPWLERSEPNTLGATVAVRGLTSPAATVQLWIDETLSDESTAAADGGFTAILPLSAGTHSIQATALAHGRASLPGNAVLVAARLAGALTAPVLDAPVSPTNNNPYTVTGAAAANSTVRLYVNGKLSTSATSGADGRFSVAAALLDGANSLYATLWDGNVESAPSNTITVEYVNTRPRSQGGTINQNTVWTPGSGEPYVISTPLIVAAGVTFTLQPGTIIKFNINTSLQLNGALVVQGTAAAPVTFTSGQASPAAGNWGGIQLNAAAPAAAIEGAVIEYAATGLLFNNSAPNAVGRSTLRNNGTGARFNAGGGTLSGTVIRNNGTGVHVAPKAAPRLTGGNEITANNYGVYAQGNTVAADNPAPVVTGNSLYGNSQYNYFATTFGAPAATVLDATGNWWGSADPAAIAAKIFDYGDSPSASPTVDFTGLLDGPNGNVALVITGVRVSPEQFNPVLNTPVTYAFRLPLPANAELRIMEEGATLPARIITQSFAEAGPQTLAWDGRDGDGHYVNDGAYYPVIILSNGQQTYTYAPTPGPPAGGSGVIALRYNVYRNDFFKIDYTMGAPGLVRMRVAPQGEPVFYPINWKPYPGGVSLLVWDGRRPDGSLVDKPVSLYFDPPKYLRFGTTIVSGIQPTIRGTGAAPAVEVKADPYLVVHSYEQIARMAYQLDQDADVTIKMLPPGVADPTNPQAITLIDNQRQAASDGQNPKIHSVEWRGYRTADTHAIQTAGNGAYTFTIQATSAATGRASLYRGVLQLFQ